MNAATPTTVDQALATIAEWSSGSARHHRPDPNTGRGALLVAAELLAEWVRARRPAMPHAQRGRTVAHAVEVHQLGDGLYALGSLCGGLAAEHHDAEPDVEPLPMFDPTAHDACKTCVRRLPRELRPTLPPDHVRPHRQRDRLAGVSLQASIEPAVVVFDATGTIATYPAPVELRRLIADVRRALAVIPEPEPVELVEQF